MNSYYYLRLCQPRTYLPLEEYPGREGIIDSRENADELLTFDSREEAGECLEQYHSNYPDRIMQVCHHIEKDNRNPRGVIRI